MSPISQQNDREFNDQRVFFRLELTRSNSLGSGATSTKPRLSRLEKAAAVSAASSRTFPACVA